MVTVVVVVISMLRVVRLLFSGETSVHAKLRACNVSTAFSPGAAVAVVMLGKSGMAGELSGAAGALGGGRVLALG